MKLADPGAKCWQVWRVYSFAKVGYHVPTCTHMHSAATQSGEPCDALLPGLGGNVFELSTLEVRATWAHRSVTLGSGQLGDVRGLSEKGRDHLTQPHQTHLGGHTAYARSVQHCGSTRMSAKWQVPAIRTLAVFAGMSLASGMYHASV
jgi:hypothetical protein